MAPTNYTVASAATLLGAKPPKRREIQDVYFAKMAATDKPNREQSDLQRRPERKRKEAKKVRFTPSTMDTSDSPSDTNVRVAGKGVEDAIADGVSDIQAEELITRAGTSGVTASFISPEPAPGPSNAVGNTERKKNCKATGSPARQGPKDAAARGAEVENMEARPAIIPALPYVHTHRLNANSHAHLPVGYTRIDTSSGRKQNDDDTGCSNSAATAADSRYTASASASASASSSSHSRGRHADDIFFTPVSVNRSTIEFEFLNAPMSAPRVLGSDDSFEGGRSSRSSDSPLLRKGKEAQYKYQQPRRPSYDRRSRRRSSVATTKKEKITVSPEQLDRLIIALANAPLLQNHLRKQWLESDEPEQTGNPSLLSLRSALQQTEPTDSTPSLTDHSTASEAHSESSGSLYNRANATFVNESDASSPLDGEDGPTSNEHHLAYTRPRARFGGIALTDPKVHGAPIRFISKGYKKGANVLQVGQCSFLNVPYGASVDSIMRIEPGDIANGGAACSVTVQVMAQVLERRKGRKVYLLVAEVDVTESMTKAVLVEFARHTGMSLENIEIMRPEPVRHDSIHESVDWCALADEFQASYSTNEIIENAGASFKSLDAETCTMQTLTLLSELERIRAQHVDFLVLRSTTTSHSNGMPTGITVPWISQHLNHHVNLWSPEASSLFREDLVAAVGRRHADGEPFAVRVLWGRKKKIVRCVPLLEGEGGKTASWVAFLGDEFDF